MFKLTCPHCGRSFSIFHKDWQAQRKATRQTCPLCGAPVVAKFRGKTFAAWLLSFLLAGAVVAWALSWLEGFGWFLGIGFGMALMRSAYLLLANGAAGDAARSPVHEAPPADDLTRWARVQMNTSPSTGLSPGEQPRTPDLLGRNMAIGLAMLAVLTAPVWLSAEQRSNFNEYRLYFTEDRQAARFRLDELSKNWTEATLRTRFAGHRIACAAYRDTRPADRACGVDVKSYNGVPSLYISFFFDKGELRYMWVNTAWWAHGQAHGHLQETLGRPSRAQPWRSSGVRLQGWELPDGAAVFVNRDRPANPLRWGSIFWNSPSSCERNGCFLKPGKQ